VLFIVPKHAAALSLRETRTIDAAGAADLRFDAVRLPAEARLPFADAHAAVADALEWGLVGLAVESAALITASNARRSLTELSTKIDTLRAMETYFVEGWAKGPPEGAHASILKVRGTEIVQAMSEVALDLAGPYAGVDDPQDLHRALQGEDDAAQIASAVTHQYLYGRCGPIFGRTNEVQRNIIAKSYLTVDWGLP
jgi:hypothetical protein